MKVLITGGSGFVGAHVVRRFADAGHEVTVFGPGPEPCLTAADLARVALVAESITDADAVARAVSDAAPDLIVGLAAYGGDGHGLMRAAAAHEADALAVNVAGFRNLLAAATAQRVRRVLWASTLAVYGDAGRYPGGAVDEASPPAPQSFYGLTKVLAEQIAGFYRTEVGLDIVGLRLPLAFGPGLWYRGVAAEVTKLFEAAVAFDGKASAPYALAADDAPIDLMYVADVAQAFLHLADHDGPTEPLYNLSAFAMPLGAFASEAMALVPGFEVALDERPAAIRYPSLAGTAFADDTGFRPAHDLRAACADYLDAIRRAD
ncbi:MAG: NAD(P)-dependent oxidoreductase [Alphaproteobacteria bacterium]